MLKKIKNKDFTENVFKLIEDDFFLLLAEKPDGSLNAMTAQWGSLGHLWGHNVASVFVRPQRYTYEFIQAGERFSLNFFDPEKYAEMLKYMGTVSGRDEPKIELQNLTPIRGELKIPYFSEARLVLNCRKLYADMISEAKFYDRELCEKIYPKKDFHLFVIGAIEESLAR